jgi:hypothetical protein
VPVHGFERANLLKNQLLSMKGQSQGGLVKDISLYPISIYTVAEGLPRDQSGMTALVMPLCGTGITGIKFHNQTPQVV